MKYFVIFANTRVFRAALQITSVQAIGYTYEKLNYPGADPTEIYGFNDLGQIVGGYWENGMKYGFVMTPVPLPAALHLLRVGLGSLILNTGGESELPRIKFTL
jgi:hypothetical protein